MKKKEINIFEGTADNANSNENDAKRVDNFQSTKKTDPESQASDQTENLDIEKEDSPRNKISSPVSKTFSKRLNQVDVKKKKEDKGTFGYYMHKVCDDKIDEYMKFQIQEQEEQIQNGEKDEADRVKWTKGKALEMILKEVFDLSIEI